MTRPFDNSVETLLDRYAKNQRPIDVNFRKLIPELNKADRATHLIHTYPAKLLMHIPHFFLNNEVFSQQGDYILDPFCGSGTVLLESILSGRNSYGADANPLARLIASVKVNKYDVAKLIYYSDILHNTIKKTSSRKLNEVVNIDYWFLPNIKRQLAGIYDQVSEIPEKKYRDFFLVCFSNCVKKVSLADPRVSVPVRLRTDQYIRGHPFRKVTRNYIKSLETLVVKEKFFEIIRTNIARVHSYNALDEYKTGGKVVSTDARKLDKIKTSKKKCVDMIITSPPYAGAQKYIRASSLNISWLDLTKGKDLKGIEKVNIGREDYLTKDYKQLQKTGIPRADNLLNKIYKINPLRSYIASNYLNEMSAAFQESVDVLKTGGYFVLVAANNQVCGNEFRTQDYLNQILQEKGLKVVLRLVDDIKSYGLMTKRNKSASIITREWVLVFRK